MSEQNKVPAHTPGPWWVEGGEQGRRHILAAYKWPDGEHVAPAIATTPGEGVGPFSIQREANARLIAAAPELLNALKVLYADTADYITRNNLGDVHQNQPMRMALSAIAKAEGR